MFTVNKNPSPRDVRWFALGMLAGFPLLAILFYMARARAGGDHVTLFATSLAIGVFAIGVLTGMAALAAPSAGRWLYVAWMTLTLPIGVVMSTLLLSLIYFLFLPVFSWVVRRNDPLRMKTGGSTYWENYKPHEPTIERMRRPF